MKAYFYLFRNLLLCSHFICWSIFGLSLGVASIVNANPTSQSELWSQSQSNMTKKRSYRSATEAHQLSRNLILNESMMREKLIAGTDENKLNNGSQAPAYRSFDNKMEGMSYQTVPLPLSDGSTLNVQIEMNQILPEKLSEKFPEIRTFRVIPDDVVVTGRLDITSLGFHAMIQMRNGDTFLIDPKTTQARQRNTSLGAYISYRKQDQEINAETSFSCGAVHSEKLSFSEQRINSNQTKASSHASGTKDNTKSLLTYKIAIGATGEYTAKYGGTVGGALSGIVTTLNRVNQVFEQDLGIHLSLIENNDLLIYTNAGSDPYDATGLMGLVYQNQENIDMIIGAGNYDIGHLFTTRGGGLAAIASVCNTSRKAMGISGVSNPKNDSFNLDFVAHEIGHQLGANHTFNGVNGACAGGNRNARTAFEPGSGSTIMSYAGHCGADNIQSNTDAMLHIGSINEIRDFTANGKGNSCGVRRVAENSPPEVDAGLDYIIPANTSFELVGSANDSDNDRMVFTWEQTDAGDRSHTDSDTGNNALFRTHIPASTMKRSFPPVQNIVNHSVVSGENLPILERSLTFSFVVQDSFNAAQSDNMTVFVRRTGSRFALNVPHASYSRGDTHKIFWNTANTNQAPVNCGAVDVSLSTDGGYNYDVQLATGIANTGNAWITIPAQTYLSGYARFKIKCSNNVFFAISSRDFKITEKGSAVLPTLVDADKPEGELADRVPQDNPVQAQIDRSSVVSGGGFDWIIMMFGVLILTRRINFNES